MRKANLTSTRLFEDLSNGFVDVFEALLSRLFQLFKFITTALFAVQSRELWQRDKCIPCLVIRIRGTERRLCCYLVVLKEGLEGQVGLGND